MGKEAELLQKLGVDTDTIQGLEDANLDELAASVQNKQFEVFENEHKSKWIDEAKDQLEKELNAKFANTYKGKIKRKFSLDVNPKEAKFDDVLDMISESYVAKGDQQQLKQQLEKKISEANELLETNTELQGKVEQLSNAQEKFEQKFKSEYQQKHELSSAIGNMELAAKNESRKWLTDKIFDDIWNQKGVRIKDGIPVKEDGTKIQKNSTTLYSDLNEYVKDYCANIGVLKVSNGKDFGDTGKDDGSGNAFQISEELKKQAQELYGDEWQQKVETLLKKK